MKILKATICARRYWFPRLMLCVQIVVLPNSVYVQCDGKSCKIDVVSDCLHTPKRAVCSDESITYTLKQTT